MGSRSRNPGREQAPVPSGAGEFVGEPIEVEGDGVRGPRRFTWRGRTYEVAEIERAWHDRGQPSTVLKPSWRTRRHRNCFDLRTSTGERFRIYLDRGTRLDSRRTWVLERVLS